MKAKSYKMCFSGGQFDQIHLSFVCSTCHFRITSLLSQIYWWSDSTVHVVLNMLCHLYRFHNYFQFDMSANIYFSLYSVH